jgi:hypothetical protein
MDSTQGPGVVGAASGLTSNTHRLRALLGAGLVATVAAMVATVLGAALAQAVGVDFELPDGGETIPLSGFAVVTGLFSVAGIVIAAALLRWSARPAQRFVQTAVSLTAISLVPPVLAGADTAATTALVALHLVAATVMIPSLAWTLRPMASKPGCAGGAEGRNMAQPDDPDHEGHACPSPPPPSTSS